MEQHGGTGERDRNLPRPALVRPQVKGGQNQGEAGKQRQRPGQAREIQREESAQPIRLRRWEGTAHQRKEVQNAIARHQPGDASRHHATAGRRPKRQRPHFGEGRVEFK